MRKNKNGIAAAIPFVFYLFAKFSNDLDLHYAPSAFFANHTVDDQERDDKDQHRSCDGQNDGKDNVIVVPRVIVINDHGLREGCLKYPSQWQARLPNL